MVDWEYWGCFDVDVVMLVRVYVEFVFDGLDMFVIVEFNGVLLLWVDNSYCIWWVWVDGWLCFIGNELCVVLCLLIIMLLLGV